MAMVASCCAFSACSMDDINHYGEPCAGWAYVKTDSGQCSSSALSECNDEFRAAYAAKHCPSKYNYCTFDEAGDKFCMSGCSSSDAPKLCNGKCVSKADYDTASIEIRDGVTFCTLAKPACPESCADGCNADGSCRTACPETCANGCNADGACKDAHEPDAKECPNGCPDGQKCVDGTCVTGNPCTGMDCGMGLACIPVNAKGKCVDIECVEDNAIKPCDAGKICSKGACIYEACAVVSCSPGKLCGPDGSCSYETAPELVVSAVEKKETSESGDAVNIDMKLNHIPAADVTLTCEIVTDSPNQEASADCSWIRFNAGNWDHATTLSVIGLADNMVDDDQAYTLKITTASEDADFNGLTFSETFINKNVDKAGILVSRTEIQTGEGGDTASFTVVLASKPASEVKIALSSSHTEYGEIENAIDNSLVLTFTPEDWNVSKTVTVVGVDDGENINDEPHNYEIVFEKAVSEDAHYHDFEVQPIKAVNLDNDKAEAIVTVVQNVICDEDDIQVCDPEKDENCELCIEEIELSREYDDNKMMVIHTDESGTNVSLRIRLGLAPTHDVEITASLWDDLKAMTDEEVQTEAELGESKLVIGKADYKEGVVLSVSGKKDYIIDEDQTYYLRLRFSSDDELYHKLDPVWIKGINANTDYAGFTKTSNVVTVDEDSEINDDKASSEYEISLLCNPQTEVNVEFQVEDATEVKISPASMVFNAENWNQPQILKIDGKIDNIVDGDIKSKISMSVSGEKYVASDELEVTTVDINTANINISAKGGAYREGSDETIEYEVWLNAKPQEEVVIKLVSSNPSALSVVGNSVLTFDASNWDIHKKVTLKAGEDVEENEYVRINMTSYSDEEAFNKLTAVSPEYIVIDTSGANVSLSSSKTTLKPGDYVTSVNVALSQDPMGSLTVTLLPSNDKMMTISPKTVTFTSSDWDKPQSVNVTVTDANVAKSAKSIEKISAVTSTSGPYDKVKPKKDLDLTIYQFTSRDFGFTGGSQNIVLKPGKYRFEVWGAQGGATGCTGYYPGGAGGYSAGDVTVSQEKKYFVHVGGAGTGCVAATCYGGYNGGGTVIGNAWVWMHHTGSGGGATHIATADGVLSTLANNRSAILLVAGGGGGARDQMNHVPQAVWGYGMAGGGLSGAGGCAGTQAEGSGSGMFGQGLTIEAQAAGGGGYWGGGFQGGNGWGGGCGGSGYIGGVQNGVSTVGVQGGHGYARISIAE